MATKLTGYSGPAASESRAAGIDGNGPSPAKPVFYCISQSQELDDLVLVEAYHRLAVDDGYRSRLEAEIEQLFQCRLVGADIFFDESDALLR